MLKQREKGTERKGAEGSGRPQPGLFADQTLEGAGVCPCQEAPVLPWTALESHFKLVQEPLSLRDTECFTVLCPLLGLTTQEMEKLDLLTLGWGQ